MGARGQDPRPLACVPRRPVSRLGGWLQLPGLAMAAPRRESLSHGLRDWVGLSGVLGCEAYWRSVAA